LRELHKCYSSLSNVPGAHPRDLNPKEIIMGETAKQEPDDIKPPTGDDKPALELEDQVEIVLDIEDEDEGTPPPQPKRNPVRDMRNRIKEQKGENSDLRKENMELKERLRTKETPAGTTSPPSDDGVPTLEGCGYDTTKYQQQYAEYNQKQLDARIDERFREVEGRDVRTAASQQAEVTIEKHYERASELKVANYEEVEDVAVAALGVDLVRSIQTTVDNSERLIYWLGMNPEKAAGLKVQFDSNPGKATFELGRLSSKLSLRPKGKQPPAPDMGVKGGGSAINATLYGKFLKKLNIAYDSGVDSLSAARAIRKEAKAAGIELPYNIS